MFGDQSAPPPAPWAACSPIVIGAYVSGGQPFGLPFKSTLIIKFKWNKPVHDIWRSQKAFFLLPCSWEALASSTMWFPIIQSSQKDVLVLRPMLTDLLDGYYSRPIFIQWPPLHWPSAINTQQHYGTYLSQFSSCNYSFSFPMEHYYTLFGATSYTWQLT